MEVVAFLLVCLVMVALVAGRKDEPDEPAEARPGLASEAERLGLDVLGNRLMGRVEGVRVVAHPPDSLAQPTVWVVVVDLPFLLPRGARAHLEPTQSGASLQPATDLADLWWLLSDPVVRRGVERLHRLGCQVELTRNLVLRADAIVLDSALAIGAELAKALGSRRVAPTLELAERMSVEAEDPFRLERLEGSIGGVDLVVSLPWVEDDRWKVRIHARWTRPLPPAEIVCKGSGRGQPTELGDIVLDTALHARSSDPDELRQRLGRDDVRGRLLDVLCNHKGSKLDSRGVTLVADDAVFELRALVDQVVELVRAVDA